MHYFFKVQYYELFIFSLGIINFLNNSEKSNHELFKSRKKSNNLFY